MDDETEASRLVIASVAATLLIGGCLTGSSAERAAVSRSEYVRFQGANLYLLVRGTDRHAPVLVWLHGGPGAAERPLFRYLNAELEKHFVVYWDQRGAGRSFDPEADPKRLTVGQHVADLDAVVDHLLATLCTDKVILVGHSWGGALGLLYAEQFPQRSRRSSR